MNNFGVGCLTYAHLCLLKESDFAEVLEEDSFIKLVYLFARNVGVEQWNRKVLFAMPGNNVFSDAPEIVLGDGPLSAMKYKVIYNIDTSDGLTNGAPGIFRTDYRVHWDSYERKSLRVWLDFDNRSLGEKICGL